MLLVVQLGLNGARVETEVQVTTEPLLPTAIPMSVWVLPKASSERRLAVNLVHLEAGNSKDKLGCKRTKRGKGEEANKCRLL